MTDSLSLCLSLSLLISFLFSYFSFYSPSFFLSFSMFQYHVREDGSFNIEYDDGDKEFKVPVTRIKVIPRRAHNGQILVSVQSSKGNGITMSYFFFR